ncbi:MAG: DUF192 domain-containing protein [Myxococcales bacterium]|nr:DUF192 domain-containing protein [Myxococcales bacterium]
MISLLAVLSCRERALQPQLTPATDRPATPELSGPHVVLRPTGHPAVTVRVEVARTHDSRMQGLMNRTQLGANDGMIFVFPESEQQTFWMRNTFLPLDMIFIKSDRRVLGVVHNATPMTDDPRQVEGVSQYVLEVNAGFAARHHIDAGTAVEFVHIPPANN